MDPLLDHLRENGAKVWRWPDVFEIPSANASAEAPSGKKLSRIVEYLVRRGKQSPATTKTLLRSVAALFSYKQDEAGVADLSPSGKPTASVKFSGRSSGMDCPTGAAQTVLPPR